MSQNILKNLSDLVHQLQRERGCISLYSDSLGKHFVEETNKQFIDTDKAIAEFNAICELEKKHQKLPIVNLEKMEACLQYLSELQKKRQGIINLTFPVSELINYYTYKAISPLLDAMIKIALFNENNDPTKVTAYTNLLYWKERTGRGRALGMRGFLTHNFSNSSFIEKIKSLISEQESYKRTFLALINPKIKNEIEEKLSPSALLRIEKLHTMIESNPDSKLLSAMTPEGWYELMTNKIDLLHEIELSLLDNLATLESPKLQISQKGITSLSDRQRDFIKSLPFFLGVSDEKLSETLRTAQTREYKKGQLLFLESEQATRLYIVLSGWVKLYKGTIAGEETILQMISSGDTIGESAVFLNSAHPVSAQIAENATLLTIPAPIIRDQIRTSTELAMNMITSMSHHSQTMIHHIEAARLKSVTERVGWFLLKLLLEQGYISREVKLPYDKSMIASYLDMKRETFSRSLKHLKAKGFKIENDTIVIPHLSSLCDFCDPITAGWCPQHSKSDCLNQKCNDSTATCTDKIQNVT